MAFTPVHGRFGDVSVNTKLLGAFCESIDLNETQDVVTLETMGGSAGAQYKTKLSGQSTATLSLSGYYDATATTGPMAVLTPLKGNDAIACICYPAGNTAGNYIATFNAILKDFKPGSKVAGAVAWSAEFEVTGAVVWTVHT